jgi:asparagine synthase (glutamine-hydrolysing)
MCGILGVVNFKKNINELIPKFRVSLNLLNHRGPDYSDIYFDHNNKFILGHARLSIRDLSSNGNQPKVSKDKRYIFTYNGELYNQIELFNNLTDKTKKLISLSCDTDVLFMHLIEFGIKKTLEITKGMFSFCFFDTIENKLYLARDPFGEKPLYYGFDDGVLIFSSDLMPIKNLFSKSPKINKRSIELLLKLDFIPNPSSVYENIFKLEPGSIIEINQNKSNSNFIADSHVDTVIFKNFNLKKYQYFELKQEFDNSYNKDNNKRTTTIDSLDKIINKSVSEQLISDVPVGCLLSSGIDSSLIASNMHKIIDKFDTFTVAYDNTEYDESLHARKIAKYLKSDHNELHLTENEVENSILDILSKFDEPFADASQIPTSLISKFASSKVKVVLTGDGGDELFGGYRRYIYSNKYRSLFKYTNHYTRQKISIIISFINKFSKSIKLNKISNKLDSISNLEDFYLNFLSNTNIDKNILKENFYIRSWFNNIPQISNKNYTEKMQYYDMLYYLTDDILHKVDRSSMMHSLETRAPFLSLDVFRESLNLKYKQKYNRNYGKIILRKILSKNLPKNLISKNKRGFGIPIGLWLRTNLKEWALDLIASKYHELDFIDHDFYLDKWNEHIKGTNNEIIIWPYLVLLNWYKNKHIN